MSDPRSAQIHSLAGLDADRVKDVVAAIWDHKDEVAGAVRFVREHGDDLVALAARLPALLAKVADQLREIGDLVERAGHGLAGTAAKLESGGKSLAALTD